MPKLILTETGNPEEKVFTLEGEATLGRLPESTVPLKGSGISREHARIALEGEEYYLIDLGSGNGTFLNGLLIKPSEKNLLRNNDRITIDNYHLKFWETDAIFEARLKEEEEITDADILEVKLLKKILDAVDQDTLPSLEVLNGVQEGKRFFLTDDMQSITIGRDPSADFCIDEYVISRQHSKIMKKWGGIALVDLESKNGTFVNNKRVMEEFLHDGDRVALGTILLLFRNPKEINVQQISEEMERMKPKPPPPPPALAEAGESPAANLYPAPPLREKQWTPLEMGMIGLGVIVFAFAAITLVNLIFQ